MKAYNIVTLGTHPEWRIQAAHWFHEKCGAAENQCGYA